jgi:predicted regulator of Ras-like GTPase activity (Roadblock/LC7/MglB family)
MSFTETLREAVGRVDGAVSAMIIGLDGITVQEYTTRKLLNLDDLSAESSQMMRDIATAAENLGLGEAKEFSIISDLCGIVMRKINSKYYMALVITPEGNYGKGRFVLRQMIPRIEDEF